MSRSEGRKRGETTEHRWEASAPIIGGYRPPTVTDGEKNEVITLRDVKAAPVLLHLESTTSERVREVNSVFALAAGAHVFMRKHQEVKLKISVGSFCADAKIHKL